MQSAHFDCGCVGEGFGSGGLARQSVMPATLHWLQGVVYRAYVCMCASEYVCISVCIHVYIRVCVYQSMYGVCGVHVSINVCICVDQCMLVLVVCPSVYVCVYMNSLSGMLRRLYNNT